LKLKRAKCGLFVRNKLEFQHQDISRTGKAGYNSAHATDVSLDQFHSKYRIKMTIIRYFRSKQNVKKRTI
jgi:hypothetical protein